MKKTPRRRPAADDSKMELKEWLQSIIIAVIIAFVLKMFIVDFAYVDGSSMYPTLKDGERIVVNQIGYRFGEPQYGDIVTLHYDASTEFVKRIIGMGGDRIKIVDNVVYRNGEPLDEPYINTEDYPDFEEVVVPAGKYFVMGDNRAHSSDSRFAGLGFVDRDALIGKVVFRFWPFDVFGPVESSGYDAGEEHTS